MALELAKESDIKYTKYEINTDRQAAIKAVAKPRQQSGQQIIKRVISIFAKRDDESRTWKLQMGNET